MPGQEPAALVDDLISGWVGRWQESLDCSGWLWLVVWLLVEVVVDKNYLLVQVGQQSLHSFLQLSFLTVKLARLGLRGTTKVARCYTFRLSIHRAGHDLGIVTLTSFTSSAIPCTTFRSLSTSLNIQLLIFCHICFLLAFLVVSIIIDY